MRWNNGRNEPYIARSSTGVVLLVHFLQVRFKKLDVAVIAERMKSSGMGTHSI